MATVIITRTTNRFTRTINGAWVECSSDRQSILMDEAHINRHLSLGDFMEVEWPDGVIERAHRRGGHGHATIPADGRLAKLLMRPSDIDTHESLLDGAKRLQLTAQSLANTSAINDGDHGIKSFFQETAAETYAQARQEYAWAMERRPAAGGHKE